MEHLFNAWPSFSAEFTSASHILLLCDYDGTLTPIVQRPDDARLPPEVREKLRALAARPGLILGIVSGRSLDDVQKLVNVDGLYYVGNHGLEIAGPGLKFVVPEARQASVYLTQMATRLCSKLAEFSGVLIEDKGLSLSVHYRLVKEGERPALDAIFFDTVAPLLRESKIRVSAGKMVWNIAPDVSWNKGKAVQVLVEHIHQACHPAKLVTVYLGDDITDEDAFRVVRRPGGWSIFVGQRNESFSAEYYLSNPEEVLALLSRLIQLR